MNRIPKLLPILDPSTAYLVTNPTDIYYLIGLDLSAGTLLIDHACSFLLVDGRYYEAVKSLSPVPTYLSKENLLFDLLKNKKVLIDQENTTLLAFLKLKEKAEKAGVELIPHNSLIKPLRAIKDPDEVIYLQEAAKLGEEGFDLVFSLLTEGVQEREVATELEYYWKNKGAQGVAFEPIIAFGPNSALPHYRAGEARLQKNDIALIDIGVKWQHYHSDMTRVFFFGNPDEQLKTIYRIVKQAYTSALKLVKPGVSVSTLDQAARNVIQEAGYGEYFTHSLGHGVGLEIHEYPLLKGEALLEKGMAITIEPGIYLPGLGGVRLEDTVLVTETGYENLSKRHHAEF